MCGFILRELISNHELLHKAMKHLFQLYSEGKIEPVIDQVFALEEVSAVATFIDTSRLSTYITAPYCRKAFQLSACSADLWYLQ